MNNKPTCAIFKAEVHGIVDHTQRSLGVFLLLVIRVHLTHKWNAIVFIKLLNVCWLGILPLVLNEAISAKLMHRANCTQMHSAIQLGAKTLCNIGVYSSRYQFIDELASPGLRIANVNRPVHNLPTPIAQKKPDGLPTPQGSTLRIRICLIIFQKLKKTNNRNKQKLILTRNQGLKKSLNK